MTLLTLRATGNRMRDSPTVRAALKVVSQGGAVASPHTQFHLLDAGFLCGQVEAVVN